MEKNGVPSNEQAHQISRNCIDEIIVIKSSAGVLHYTEAQKCTNHIINMVNNIGQVKTDDHFSADINRYEEVQNVKECSTNKTGDKYRKIKYYVMLAAKAVALVVLLYLFICSLDLLSSALRLLGGKAAAAFLQNSELLKNPVAGLMIGVLATALVQSSSTTTSIIVLMVGSDVLTAKQAIPLVMGANVGTSVTNTIVSIGHVGNAEEFKRAFAGATVHDMFNWLTVIVLLPVEVVSGMLDKLTRTMVQDIKSAGRRKPPKLLKALTGPFTGLIIKLDKNVIKNIALNQVKEGEKIDLIKRSCGKEQVVPCTHLFAKTTLSNTVVGGILLVIALLLLIVCLLLIVKILHSILSGKLTMAAKKVVNQNFPKPFGWLTGYFAILIGCLMTMVIQSSSVFTSTLTPLVGLGVLQLERMYPLTIGSNVGTTVTTILAALAADPDNLAKTLQIALCHLFFNVFGILIFYPIPFMRQIPIGAARKLGQITGKYRWFVIVYLLSMFIILPGIIFLLSYSGLPVLLGVGIPILVVVLIVVVVNILQRKRPACLPTKLRTWEFLPDPIHRLAWWDKIILKFVLNIQRKLCCCCGKQKKQDANDAEITELLAIL